MSRDISYPAFPEHRYQMQWLEEGGILKMKHKFFYGSVLEAWMLDRKRRRAEQYADVQWFETHADDRTTRATLWMGTRHEGKA